MSEGQQRGDRGWRRVSEGQVAGDEGSEVIEASSVGSHRPVLLPRKMEPWEGFEIRSV